METSQFADWLRGIASVVALASAIASVRACSVTERSLKLHLEPELVCVLDEAPRSEGFLLFSLKNEGPIAATNVVVDHIALQYEKAKEQIRVGVYPGGGSVYEYSLAGRRWIFDVRLEPNEIVHKLTGGALRDAKDIDILIFDVSAYRETDGKQFAKRCTYYLEGTSILTVTQFRSHPQYAVVVGETDRVLDDFINREWGLDKRGRQ